jgi:hypothetical protein
MELDKMYEPAVKRYRDLFQKHPAEVLTLTEKILKGLVDQWANESRDEEEPTFALGDFERLNEELGESEPEGDWIEPDSRSQRREIWEMYKEFKKKGA